jgi:hypothetical protein
MLEELEKRNLCKPGTLNYYVKRYGFELRQILALRLKNFNITDFLAIILGIVAGPKCQRNSMTTHRNSHG